MSNLMCYDLCLMSHLMSDVICSHDFGLCLAFRTKTCDFVTLVDALSWVDMSVFTHSYSIWGTSTPNGGLCIYYCAILYGYMFSLLKFAPKGRSTCPIWAKIGILCSSMFIIYKLWYICIHDKIWCGSLWVESQILCFQFESMHSFEKCRSIGSNGSMLFK